MRYSSRTSLSLLFLILFITANAVAQNYLYGTGSQTWGINIPVENGFINVANGQVHLEIPIATLPQRGSLPLQERLVYDSRIWQLVATGSTIQFEPTNVPVSYSGVSPTCTGNPQAACTSQTSGSINLTNLNVPNSMAGWRFVQGNETGIAQAYLSGNIGNLDAQSTWNWGYTDPTGTIHMFAFMTGTVWCPSCGPTSASGYAVDGSGYYMTVTNTPYSSVFVYDPSGNQVYPAVVDRNGNTYTSSNGNLVDTLGRTPVVQSTNGNTTTYSVLTIGGATKTFTITTETLNVNTAFGQSGVNDYSGTLTAIQSITLPDGSSYAFTYDSGTSSGNYGELQSITLPTGGTVSFTYQDFLDSYQNQNRWLSGYSGGDIDYTFSPQVVTQCSSNGTGCQEQMTVTDGVNERVVYLLTLNNGAWNTQMDYYNNNNAHILSTASTYTYPTPCTSYGCIGAQWITAANTTTTLSDTGQVATTRYTYGQPWFGKPTKTQMWDYNIPTTSTPSKEIDYTYGYLVNGAAFVTQMNQLDSQGNLAGQTQYEYDGQNNLNSSCPTAGVQATNNLPNHQAAPGTRGNLTCVIAGAASTATQYPNFSLSVSSPIVITSSAYDDAGAKLSDTDGRGNTTAYTTMCSDAYVSNVKSPVVVNGQNLQTSTSYDCPSGLLLSSKDMNGVASGLSTSYAYFTSGTNIGRLETVSNPDGGSTSSAYPSTTETDTTIAQTQSTAFETKSLIDTYGWPYQSVQIAPEGAITSEVYVDPAGNTSQITNPHLSGKSNPTDGSTYYYHDVLHRLTGDSNGRHIAYSGNAVTVTDEVGNSKQYTYDAFHRLTKVMEPNAAGTLAYETDYAYNGLDQLIEVDQWGGANGSSSPGDRKRIYSYDSLGRLIASNEPENQSSLTTAHLTCSNISGPVSWTTCYSLDGNGNIASSTDNAGNVVSYSYDGLNRILSEQQTTGGTLNYTFQYDGTDSYTHTNPLGNLTFSKNNNASAAESLSYDSMERITNENVCVPGNCAFGTSGINIAAKYDYAGNLVQLTYPDGRIIQPTVDTANRPTGIPYPQWGSLAAGSFYSTSAFFPPGQPSNSAYGNGATIATSFNYRQSIASLVYSNSSGAAWSKQYYWDKNAQNLLLAVDGITGYGRQYTYDTLNRVTSAQDVGINNPGSSKATATVTISGSEQFGNDQCHKGQQGCQQFYDFGTIGIGVNGVGEYYSYGQGATPTSIASSLTSMINLNSQSYVTASASAGLITLTSKVGGTASDYPLSTSVTYDTYNFPHASFSATPSGANLTGGSSSPPPNPLIENYTYDPFGNLTQSGNFSFSQSFTTLNQMASGYSYDANGNQNTDVSGHALTFDANGMLSSWANSAETYVYDAQGNRIAVNDGVNGTDYVYFGGVPIATLSNNGTSATYATDLIYADSTLIAEVGASQTATPVYRAVDYLTTLGGDIPGSGVLASSVNYAPYGQLFSGSTSDQFGFPGLLWDNSSALWHASARELSPQQGRWMSPDPYAGSYDWTNPQSLNRYAYVNGSPMSATDPTGEGDFPISPVAAAGPMAGPAEVMHLIANAIVDFLNRSNFHGSLQPRARANPWDDKFGIPYPGLGGSIGQAAGLPGAGCDFGPCVAIKTFSSTAIPFPSVAGETGIGSLARWSPWGLVTWMTLNMTGDSAKKTDPVEALKRDCQYIRTVTEPATGRAYKDGISTEDEYNCSGTIWTIHTIWVNGVNVHGPHIRPGPAKGGASE